MQTKRIRRDPAPGPGLSGGRLLTFAGISPAESAAHRAARIILPLLAFTGIFLRVLRFPTVARDSSLDFSWGAALSYFASSGLEYGKDIIYTYGPLGYMLKGSFTDHAWATQIAGNVILSAFVAAVYVRTAFILRKPGLLVVAVPIAYGLGDTVVAATPCLVFTMLWLGDRRSRWESAIAAGGLAALALVKFTVFLIAVPVVLAAALLYWTRGERRGAFVWLLAFGVVFGLLWTAFGGGAQAFLLYIEGSFQVAAGYAQMYLPAKLEWLESVSRLAAVIAALGLTGLLSRRDPGMLLNTAVWAFAAFAIWRSTFTRADVWHARAFFSLLPMLAAVLLAPVEARSHRRVAAGLTVVVLFLTVTTLCRTNDETFTEAFPNRLWTSITATARNITHPGAWLIGNRGVLQARESRFALSNLKSRIGSAAVDVLGDAQAIAIFNRLNYRPRPAFQGFIAYNPYLIRRNYEHYLNSAPPFVLFGSSTIDGRYLPQEDSAALAYTLFNYSLAGSERGYLLFRKQRDMDVLREMTPVETMRFEEGRAIGLSRWNAAPLWCSVTIEPDLLSSLRTAVYQPKAASLIVDTVSKRFVHRFLPDPAATGFIVNPLLESPTDMAALLCGGTPTRVQAMTLEFNSGASRKRRGVVRLYSLPSPAPHPACPDRSDPIFGAAPLSIETAIYKPVEIEGSLRMLVHAPGLVTFAIPERAYRVSGEFGIAPGAYTAPGHTDGVVFQVAVDRGGEPATIWEHWSRPLTEPGDRRVQRFEVNLPAGSRTLYLRTGIGPAGNGDYDWSAWSDIRFSAPER